jgi:hypothetical protein
MPLFQSILASTSEQMNFISGRVHHHYHYAPPRPVYVEHRYRPVVVERHYYPAPVYHAAPAPSGFFFGMSIADAGSAFSLGLSGR